MVNEEDKEGHSYVCKTRNLNICKESVIKNMGLAYTHRCAKCQEVSTDLLYITHVYRKYIRIQLLP